MGFCLPAFLPCFACKAGACSPCQEIVVSFLASAPHGDTPAPLREGARACGGSVRPELSHSAGYESKDIRTALWHFENPHKNPLACDNPDYLQTKPRKRISLVSSLTSPGVCSSCGINTKGTLATILTGMKIHVHPSGCPPKY